MCEGTTQPAPERRVHVLVAEHRACPECPPGGMCEACQDDPDCSYRIECPGVTDDCRAWWECDRNRRKDRPGVCLLHWSGDRDDWDDEPVAHGEVHRRIDGIWMVRSNDCLGHVGDWDEGWEVSQGKPGRYPVRLSCEDGYVTLDLRDDLAAALHQSDCAIVSLHPQPCTEGGTLTDYRRADVVLAVLAGREAATAAGGDMESIADAFRSQRNGWMRRAWRFRSERDAAVAAVARVRALADDLVNNVRQVETSDLDDEAFDVWQAWYDADVAFAEHLRRALVGAGDGMPNMSGTAAGDDKPGMDGAGDEPRPCDEPAALRIDCPHCKATAGEWCGVHLKGRGPYLHPSRRRAAEPTGDEPPTEPRDPVGNPSCGCRPGYPCYGSRRAPERPL